MEIMTRVCNILHNLSYVMFVLMVSPLLGVYHVASGILSSMSAWILGDVCIIEISVRTSVGVQPLDKYLRGEPLEEDNNSQN